MREARQTKGMKMGVSVEDLLKKLSLVGVEFIIGRDVGRSEGVKSGRSLTDRLVSDSLETFVDCSYDRSILPSLKPIFD
jgi:hypothetical protein